MAIITGKRVLMYSALYYIQNIIAILFSFFAWFVGVIVLISMHPLKLRAKYPNKSPYYYLRNRRIDDDKWEDSPSDMLILMAPVFILAYFFVAVIALTAYFVNSGLKVEEAVNLIGTMTSDNLLSICAFTVSFLAIETFTESKTRDELSSDFYVRHNIGRIRLLSFICAIATVVFWIAFTVLFPDTKSLLNPDLDKLLMITTLIILIDTLFVAHIFLLLMVVLLHLIYSDRRAKRQIATKLHFNRIGQETIREGSPELRYETFRTLLAGYQKFSFAVFDCETKVIEKIEFACPLERRYLRSARQNIDQNTNFYMDNADYENKRTYWYRRAFRKFYLYSVGMLLTIIALSCALWSEAASWTRIAFCIESITLFIFLIEEFVRLHKINEKYYKSVTEGYPDWTYFFVYKIGGLKKQTLHTLNGAERYKTDCFCQENFFYKHTHKPYPNYIRVILSMFEFVRQSNALNASAEFNDRTHKDIKDFLRREERLSEKYLAWYRSLLLLYDFALLEERREMYHAEREEYAPSIETMVDDFLFCLEPLMRLAQTALYEQRTIFHDKAVYQEEVWNRMLSEWSEISSFLKLVILDYYRDVGEKGENRHGRWSDFEKELLVHIAYPDGRVADFERPDIR